MITGGAYLNLLLMGGVFLAFSNGANDNFKGVATLFGSKATTYKVALWWGTLATLAGSIAALFFAQKILANFSGKGLVPDAVAQMNSFAIAVSFSAAATVFLATKFGFPISTTHAVTGSLVGAGFLGSPDGLNLSKLFATFFAPLLLSPILAIGGAILMYPCFMALTKRWKIDQESCICLEKEANSGVRSNLLIRPGFGTSSEYEAALSATGFIPTQEIHFPNIVIDSNASCETRFQGKAIAIKSKSLMDGLHFLSAGLISFARGLNDTPKIAALLLIGQVLHPMYAIGLTSLAIAVGGLLMAKKVAQRMSFEITDLNEEQGLSANFISSLIVLGASYLGVPVSTTHVSCGAIYGIGVVTKKVQYAGILKIVASWLVTLPVAIGLGYLSFLLLNKGSL